MPDRRNDMSQQPPWMESLLRWGGPQDAFRVANAEPEGSGYRAELRFAERQQFCLDLRFDPDGNLALIAADFDVPASLVDKTRTPVNRAALEAIAAEVGDNRIGTLVCSFWSDGSSPHFRLAVTIYGDGFTRHNLNLAVLEIGKARRQIEARMASMAGPVAEASYLAGHNAQPADASVPFCVDDPGKAPAATGRGVSTSAGTQADEAKEADRSTNGLLAEAMAYAQSMRAAGQSSLNLTAPQAPGGPSPRVCTNPACRAPAKPSAAFCTSCGASLP